MKIIDQYYEILSLPDNLLAMIEKAGRTCYKSESKIGCNAPKDHIDWKQAKGSCISPRRYELDHKCDARCPFHSSQKFVKMIRDKGHHAMLEFGGDITVKFITNRGVTHELVRHRLFSFAQESTRYVRYDGQMEFIKPVWFKTPLCNLNGENDYEIATDAEERWYEAMEQAEMAYEDLIEEGWRPEQAREVLPNSLKTEIVVKGNSREWRHALKLRTSKKAHPQIRSLILPLLTELKEKVPIIFDDI